MSAAEVASVGTTLVLAPYACAFLSWRYAPEFEHRSDMRGALDSIAGLAATRAGTSCLRRDTLPPAAE
jgi:hypothetical protein